MLVLRLSADRLDRTLKPAEDRVPCAPLLASILAPMFQQTSVPSSSGAQTQHDGWVFPGIPNYFAKEKSGNTQVHEPRSATAQLVEHASVKHYDPTETATRGHEVDLHDMEMIIRNPIQRFEDVADEVKIDTDLIRMRIPMFPASIRDPDKRYTVPTVVAIGPYHHGRDHLRHAEKMKRVAALHCIRRSGYSVQQMYDAVVSVAHNVRRLYDKDVIEGINDCDFLPMMFYDACFLVQYMLAITNAERIDPSLMSYIDSNDNDIYHDIMVLENQLPWPIVQTVMRFTPVPLAQFIDDLRDGLQNIIPRKIIPEEQPYFDDSYEPPHLLGLIRFYMVGKSQMKQQTPPPPPNFISVSPNELAEIGISLKANYKIDLTGMRIKKKGPFFADLCMPPLQLDARPSWLINMAALEVCMSSNFRDTEDEDSAVCSYLNLLTMLVHREADVYDLRRKRLLRGGGGFTDKDALEFFSCLRDLRHGSCYVRTVTEIMEYKIQRRLRTKIHAFFYKNIKIIATVFSAIVALIGILRTLKALNFM
ncbi:hypothetical protein EJB05_32409, partial [Eragrostis curvula]